MVKAKNGHTLSTTQNARPRYTGERLLRERPKIYRQIVRLLSEGWSVNKICKWCHVTRETVRAVERRRFFSETSVARQSTELIFADAQRMRPLFGRNSHRAARGFERHRSIGA